MQAILPVSSKQQLPRPFLKWAGGKTQLIQQYSPLIPPQFNRYYEPFLGGGAIFFYLAAQCYLAPRRQFSAQLSDINPELVNVYCCVRDRVEELILRLQQHQACHAADYYYQVRASLPQEPIDRAARLLYLNKTCFNGLYRENAKGKFNVPLGRYQKPNICDVMLLRSASQVLQKTEIHLKSFQAIEQEATANDFVYFDPPYHPISPTSNFTAYSRYCFSEADQTQLRDVFNRLADRGVKVMLSNSDCDLVRSLYADWQIHPISAARSINSNTQKRQKITEVLVTSY